MQKDRFFRFKLWKIKEITSGKQLPNLVIFFIDKKYNFWYDSLIKMDSLVAFLLSILLVFTWSYATDLDVSSHSRLTEAKPIAKNFSVETKSHFGLKPIMQSIPAEGRLDSAFTLLEVSLSATEWSWRIRRSGVFACQVLESRVRAPFDVLVDFEKFANLTNANTNVQINTWYAISQNAPPPPRSNSWIPANKLNASDFIIPAPISGTSWNLWCMVEVTDNVIAVEYQNQPIITFVLQGVTDWVEPLVISERQLRW